MFSQRQLWPVLNSRISLDFATEAIASIARCKPISLSTRAPFGEICRPAPSSWSSAACSYYSDTLKPFCTKAIAATMPPMPAPAIMICGLFIVLL